MIELDGQGSVKQPMKNGGEKQAPDRGEKNEAYFIARG